ncbi:Uncharacterized protein Rs2_36227 [Raphanus sativus]|nr:Uncharacterized protein Rs2_36227 [Raphanus sativus]
MIPPLILRDSSAPLHLSFSSSLLFSRLFLSLSLSLSLSLHICSSLSSDLCSCFHLNHRLKNLRVRTNQRTDVVMAKEEGIWFLMVDWTLVTDVYSAVEKGIYRKRKMESEAIPEHLIKLFPVAQPEAFDLIRLTEAQQQKTALKDLKPEQLEKFSKLEEWRQELKALEDKEEA